MTEDKTRILTDGENYIWNVGITLIEQYDISADTWTILTTIPRGMILNNYICVYWDDYIIMRNAGNAGSDGVFHAYHVTQNLWKKSYVAESIEFGKSMVALIPI